MRLLIGLEDSREHNSWLGELRIDELGEKIMPG
jgi:hypothetical protein